MKELEHIGFCGVDCSACPDYAGGKCPDCRNSLWPEGDQCMPVVCCSQKDILCCGQCGVFPCGDMAGFYEESESHRAAYARMAALRDNRGGNRENGTC